MSVRLTREAKLLATAASLSQTPLDDTERVNKWADYLYVTGRDRAIYWDAIRRVGVNGVRALAHLDCDETAHADLWEAAQDARKETA